MMISEQQIRKIVRNVLNEQFSAGPSSFKPPEEGGDSRSLAKQAEADRQRYGATSSDIIAPIKKIAKATPSAVASGVEAIIMAPVETIEAKAELLASILMVGHAKDQTQYDEAIKAMQRDAKKYGAEVVLSNIPFGIFGKGFQKAKSAFKNLKPQERTAVEKAFKRRNRRGNINFDSPFWRRHEKELADMKSKHEKELKKQRAKYAEQQAAARKAADEKIAAAKKRVEFSKSKAAEDLSGSIANNIKRRDAAIERTKKLEKEIEEINLARLRDQKAWDMERELKRQDDREWSELKWQERRGRRAKFNKSSKNAMGLYMAINHQNQKRFNQVLNTGNLKDARAILKIKNDYLEKMNALIKKTSFKNDESVYKLEKELMALAKKAGIPSSTLKIYKVTD